MSDDDAGTWPEQDAVLAWWDKHRLELCEMVSAYRIQLDRDMDAETEFDGDELAAQAPTDEPKPSTVQKEEAAPAVKISDSGVRTVDAADIIRSEEGKAGLAASKALFARVSGEPEALDVTAYRWRYNKSDWRLSEANDEWYGRHVDNPMYDIQRLVLAPVEPTAAREALDELVKLWKIEARKRYEAESEQGYTKALQDCASDLADALASQPAATQGEPSDGLP